MLPFIPDAVYKRSVIHDQYGGTRRGGISYSARHPYIFIFSGLSGKKHGYEDSWDNPNVFSYTGEGQGGDMSFTKGNLALRDHLQAEKAVYLFQSVRKAYVKFVCKLTFQGFGFFEAPDTSGKMRQAIRFFFLRDGAELPTYANETLQSIADEPSPKYRTDVPTEKQILTTTRVGQGAYRTRIIHRWEYKCAVTGFHKHQVLIASHIVPWRHAADDERLDVNNGILLSPTYDALFDRHLITFENSGRIILSNDIELQAYQKIGVTGNEKISKFNTQNHPFLEKHRETFVRLTHTTET